VLGKLSGDHLPICPVCGFHSQVTVDPVEKHAEAIKTDKTKLNREAEFAEISAYLERAKELSAEVQRFVDVANLQLERLKAGGQLQ
jgi:hypothetical protein